MEQSDPKVEDNSRAAPSCVVSSPTELYCTICYQGGRHIAQPLMRCLLVAWVTECSWLGGHLLSCEWYTSCMY